MYTRKPLGPSSYEKSTGKPRKEFNRANDIRRDDDTVKDIKIGFKDIDNAIQYYFNNVIKPEVIEAGSKVKVPVVYGSPERWKNMQHDGYFRDRVGKILCPIIAYQRTSVTKNRELGNKIDANYPQLYYTIEAQYTQKNRYDAFSVLTGARPIKEFYNTIIPDYVNVTYQIVVWTNYVEDMNSIVEGILYSEGSYWGDKERFQFRTKIDNYTNTTDLLQDEERIVRTSFDLTLFGYIVSDALAKQISEHLSPKTLSQRQIQVSSEVDGVEDIFKVGAQPIAVNPLSVETGNRIPVTVNNIASVDTATLEYLNNNTQKLGVVTIPDTVTFTGNFATAPSSLPATSVANFTFFVNGTLIEPAAIISFTNPSANVCTLIVDTTELGFTLANSDEVVAIGKFA